MTAANPGYRRWLPVAVCLAAALYPLATAAQGRLWLRSTTLARGFVRPTDGSTSTHVPFFQQIELRTHDLGVEGLSLSASFWGFVDAVDLREEERGGGDLTTLFVRYRPPKRGPLALLHGLELTVGRQLVALGPTVLEQVDGGKVHYIHDSGLELGLFGGAPTGDRFRFASWPLGDDDYGLRPSWLLGGRVGYARLGLVSAGLSFVHRRDDGQVAHSDLGLDLSLSPARWLDIAANGTVSVEALRLKQAKVAAAVRPLRHLWATAGYRFSSPDLWIPRSSIFAVFSEQTFQEVFVDARWRVRRSLTLDACYGRRFYGVHAPESIRNFVSSSAPLDVNRGANRASLRGVWRATAGARLVGELQRVEQPDADSAVNRARLAATVPLSLWSRTLSLVADVDLLLLDQAVRDTRLGFVAGGYLKVPLRPDLDLLAGGTGGFSPLLRSSGSFLLRLTWQSTLLGNDTVRVTRGG